MENLYKKTISSGIWSGVEKLGSQFVQFAVGIILARLLLPEQFGLIAILMVFIGISQVVIGSGFSVALIQKEKITEEDCSTVFFFNITCAVVIYLLLVVAAPFIANFYHDPQLIPLLRVLATIIIIGSFSMVHGALLTKQLNFRALFITGLSSTIISAIIGIFMAWKGYGVWALVGQQIAQVFCRSLGLWLISPWHPNLIFCLKSLKSLFSFGSKLLGTWLVSAIFENLYTIVIGKFFSPAILGFYSRGRSLPYLLMNSANSAIGTVMLPVFSKLQNDLPRLKNAIRGTLKISFFLVFPLMAGVMITSDTLVSVLLTDKWLPCVPILQWMCVVFVFYPMHIVSQQGIIALGRTDVFFKIEMAKKLISVIALIITFKFGIVYMAAGEAIVSIISVILHGVLNRNYIHYSFSEQMRDMMYPLLISAVMCAGVYSITTYSKIESTYLLLMCQIIGGAVIYIAGSFIMRSEGLFEVFRVIRTFHQVKGTTS